jgi:DNA repair exonuclease SbcCD ATPase subunit
MRIIELRAENVKRLKAVRIQPDGSAVVTISGRNGQGKTSVLDAIAMAIGGKDIQCPDPVRHGADKGRVVVDLDDMIVTRTFTPEGGGTLKVENREGARYPSPQAILDKLVGKLTFDPLAFGRMSPKAQAETLRGLVGLDFSALDGQRMTAFEQRTDANREVKRLESQVAAIPAQADVPADEVSVANLMDALRIANLRNHDAAAKRTAAVAADAECQRIQAAASVADKAAAQTIARLERELAQAKEARQQTATEYATHVAARAAAASTAKAQAVAVMDVDTTALETQIGEADHINAAIRRQKQRRALCGQLDKAQAEADALTKRIESIDAEKRNKLAAAPFPIEGLSFAEAGVLFNRVPLEQCSSAEQLRISIAIGAAANPTLKVLLVRDGSLLDNQSLKLLEQFAEEHGLQVWLERVDESGKVGVVIEDGQVVAAEAQ